VAGAIMVVAAVMVPWVVFLAVTLRPGYHVEHWDITWIGFDTAIVAVLGWTAWAAWTRRRVTVAGLVVAATLLVCDAWFDVTTSLGHGDSWIPIVTALGGELPLAGAFLWLAHRGSVFTSGPGGPSARGKAEHLGTHEKSGMPEGRTPVGSPSK
jgi:hypothetical protein